MIRSLAATQETGLLRPLPQDPWMKAKSVAPSSAKSGGQSGTRMDLDA